MCIKQDLYCRIALIWYRFLSCEISKSIVFMTGSHLSRLHLTTSAHNRGNQPSLLKIEAKYKYCCYFLSQIDMNLWPRVWKFQWEIQEPEQPSYLFFSSSSSILLRLFWEIGNFSILHVTLVLHAMPRYFLSICI